MVKHTIFFAVVAAATHEQLVRHATYDHICTHTILWLLDARTLKLPACMYVGVHVQGCIQGNCGFALVACIPTVSLFCLTHPMGSFRVVFALGILVYGGAMWNL